MSEIFISYSSKDKKIAEVIRGKLNSYLSVFLDTESIPRGTIWEREIDAEIRNCKVFIPLVSDNSNNSDWVRRETLLALSLKKSVIPALIADELPLRLIDLNFVDFRGNIESAISDLLSAILENTTNVTISTVEANRLLSESIRERLIGNIAVSNALADRAILLDSSIISSSVALWKKLQRSFETNMAFECEPELVLNEYTVKRHEQLYRDREAYAWTLEIHGPEEVLNKISIVEYRLHPTFRDRNIRIRNRDANFSIMRFGWGTFEVGVRVEFLDQTFISKEYHLTFGSKNSCSLIDLNDS